MLLLNQSGFFLGNQVPLSSNHTPFTLLLQTGLSMELLGHIWKNTVKSRM